MKKIKILVLFLACALFVTGCGVNGNILLSPLNVNASNFYYKAMDAASFINMAAGKQISSSDYMEFSLLSTMALSGKDLGYNLISSVDFCMEIADSATSSNQKIYEYFTNYTSMENSVKKYIVHVSKVTGKSNAFNANLYITDGNVNYQDIVDKKQPATMTNTFTITRDRASGEYEITDTANDVTGTFLYDRESGKMNVSMSYDIEALSIENCITKMNFYNYTNDVVGARFMISANVEGVKTQCVYEYLSKDFAKTAKLGIVKDASLYEDMTKCEESAIAASNSGDQYGYTISHTNNSDTNQAITKVNKYGLKG